MIEDPKDRRASQIIECLKGLTFQVALDQLEYTKDFLLNRIALLNFDFSALDKEYKTKKERGAP